ncbi:type VII secretion protein EssC [Streptococcus rifensis]
MAKELIIYMTGYRYSWSLAVGESLRLAKVEPGDLVFPTLEVEDIVLELSEDSLVSISINSSETEQLEDGKYTIAGLSVFIMQEQPLTIFDNLHHQHLSLGAGGHHTITLEGIGDENEFVLSRVKDRWELISTSQTVYINNAVNQILPVILEKGDEISFDRVVIKIFDQEIWVNGVEAASELLVEKKASDYRFYEDYPDYHRSPRIIYREPEDKVTLRGPVEPPKKPTNQLLKAIVPPLAIVTMTIILSFFQSRGLFIYIMVVSSIISMIISVTGYFKSRKEYKEGLVEREELFREYLFDKAQDLYKLQEKQRQGQRYHYPSVQELEAMAGSYHHRIYEKTPQHFDFLSYRLGLGKRKASFSLSYAPLDKDKKLDDLEKEGLALYDQYKRTHELPIVTDLVSGPVGYIGPRHVVLEQLQLLVHQLSFFHSYHDLQFITLLPEEEKDLWSWMRWLPHATLQDINVRGLVYNQRSRDQVLNSLYQVLKLRKAQLGDKRVRTSTLFSPHFVVLITDQSLVIDHVIMEFFTENPTELGCSVIFVEDTLSSLSENITTIIDIKDRNHGVLTLEKGELVDKGFALDHFGEGFDKESLPRLLAPLNHLQNLKNSIPESVNFLEMYEVEEVKDLRIMERWGQHAPHKSLAVPLGLRGKEDIVQLDLHEKAHGPHGLVAGTTGSGKSEIIQSYILSLAINFHPHDVAFLLIDYKGGGMANLFKNLPHLLGAITNLDAAQSMRALISINAELKRRQRLFSQYDVNHINQYQKKYKNGEAKEPMPHLFLISDEFAELKTNEPEFMKELVSTARIGRSLGIHLILATQKPTGVVDDQIWSNSRFKLALKVATPQDSQEMLKTADAADITQAGRAYLQVGNNEIYELFQSAYSGADYQPDKDKLNIEDHTIYAINDNGQYQILTEDLSGLEDADSIQQIPSELAVIVDEIKAITEAHGIVPLPRPWLPPLKERVYLEELASVDYLEMWQKPVHDLILTIGMADIPHEQKQEVVTINLSEDGHILLYGSPGSGKSTFLQTAILDLAQNHSPEHLHFYLFDFGNNSLGSFYRLPHLADIMRVDETEKIQKFTRFFEKEINRRKQLLSQQGVASVGMYRRVTGEVIPDIVLVIDSYESMKDEAYESELFKLTTRLSREGQAIGIHLLATAGRQTNLRAVFYANVKHQLTLYQIDSGEVRSIVGSTPLASMSDVKGRGLMKRDTIDLIQLALPVSGETDIMLLENLRQTIERLSETYKGKRPEGIPMVPNELTSGDFYGRSGVQEAIVSGEVPLGLDVETVSTVTWKRDKGPLVYLVDDDKPMVTFTHQLIRISQESNRHLMILAPSYHQLPDNLGYEVISAKEALEEMLLALSVKVEDRLGAGQTDYVTTLIFYDLVTLTDSLSGESLTHLATILEKGHRSGYCSVVMTDSSITRKIDVASKVVRSAKEGLLGIRVADQTLFNVLNKPLREELLGQQLHYYISEQHVKLIKVLM